MLAVSLPSGNLQSVCCVRGIGCIGWHPDKAACGLSAPSYPKEGQEAMHCHLLKWPRLSSRLFALTPATCVHMAIAYLFVSERTIESEQLQRLVH